MLSTDYNPVVLLNGPPRAGKNFTETLLEEHFNVVQIALADAVKRAALFGHGIVTEASEQAIYDALLDMEKDKGRPRAAFGGRSWREICIITAEVHRLIFGEEFWAHTAIRRVREFDQIYSRLRGEGRVLILITDIGFPKDQSTFEDYFNQRSILLRVHRQGSTFGKLPGYEEAYGAGTGTDSRNWVFANKVASADWVNDGNEQEAQHDLIKVLGETMGWQALQATALMRNNKTVLTARMAKQYKVPQTIALQPFKNPKLYWPNLAKFIGRDPAMLDVVNTEQASR